MTETPAPRPRAHRAALLLAGISLALSLAGCLGLLAVAQQAGFSLLPVQSEPVEATAGQVEAVAHVVLPPGTVLLAAAYSNGLETRLSAKFRIPRTALDAFVTGGRFTAAPAPGARAVTAKDNVGKGNLFDPDSAVSVSGLTEEAPGPGSTYRRVLLGLDAPDTVTVYLFAWRN